MRADLNGHLKALKDYFLLAKGDFFQVGYFKLLFMLHMLQVLHLGRVSTFLINNLKALRLPFGA